MDKIYAASISNEDSLFEQGIDLLDAVYTEFSCEEYVEILLHIEKQLYHEQYANLQSLKNDLQQIPILTPEFLGKKHSSRHLKHIDLQLPIYKYISLRKESHLVTVYIKQHLELHISLIRAFNQALSAQTPPSQLPPFRLFIANHYELLLNARDTSHITLAVFINAAYKQLEKDPEMCNLVAKVALVHPLGGLHKIENKKATNLQGWIKIKVIDFRTINTVTSMRLAIKLFEGDSETVRNTSMSEDLKDLMSAQENEIRRRFLRVVTSRSYRNANFHLMFDVEPKFLFEKYKSVTERANERAIYDQECVVPENSEDIDCLLEAITDHWTKLEHCTLLI